LPFSFGFIFWLIIDADDGHYYWLIYDIIDRGRHAEATLCHFLCLATLLSRLISFSQSHLPLLIFLEAFYCFLSLPFICEIDHFTPLFHCHAGYAALFIAEPLFFIIYFLSFWLMDIEATLA